MLVDQFAYESEVLIAGGSIIRQQNKAFCVRQVDKRIRIYFPEAKVEYISENFLDVARIRLKDVFFLVLVGRDSTAKGRSEVLMRKYKEIIQKFEGNDMS